VLAAKVVTDEAIAQRAAEIMQTSSHSPVADHGKDEPVKMTSEDFWAKYQAVGASEGLDAKNEWYNANKHLKV
jgi:hypothetical protein